MNRNALAAVFALSALLACGGEPKTSTDPLSGVSGSLSGAVTITGATDLSGVEVHVSGGSYVGRAVTAADGSWRLEEVPRGAYIVRIAPAATKEGKFETAVLVDGPTSMRAAEFTGLGRVRGRVHQHEGCHDGVNIHALADPDGGSEVWPRTEADETALAFGDIWVLAGVQGLELVGIRSGQSVVIPSVAVPYNGSVDLGDLQLGPPAGTATVRGVVAVACDLSFLSELAAGAQVTLDGACRMTTTSDAHGAFEFKNAPYGHFELKFGPAEPLWAGHYDVSGWVEAGQTASVEAKIHGWGEVEGLARYSDGRSDNSGIHVSYPGGWSYNVPDVNVPSRWSSSSDLTDAEGRYLVQAPCGAHRVCLGGSTSNCIDVSVPFNSKASVETVFQKL